MPGTAETSGARRRRGLAVGQPRASARRSSRRDAWRTRFSTAVSANGQEEIRVVKVKNVVGFADEQELAAYVLELYDEQKGRCAISGIELQHDVGARDRELVCSLDRKDSAGHYERGNLQIVCCFVNRWKSDSSDEEFRRLFQMVQSAADPG